MTLAMPPTSSTSYSGNSSLLEAHHKSSKAVVRAKAKEEEAKAPTKSKAANKSKDATEGKDKSKAEAISSAALIRSY
ncbi:hypothetical protein P5E99_15915 [Clostridium perfringens]|nr:hypothetical protein [Clostridium perfringens]